MRKLLLLASCFAMLAGCAQAATLMLPSVTINSPPSTSIACTPYATSPSGVAGALLTTCTVSPTGWVGAVTLSGTQFVITGLSGNTFNVVVGSTALPPGTYAPGTLSTVP